MSFDQRTKAKENFAGRVVAPHDGMRVANVDRCQLHRVAGDVDGLELTDLHWTHIGLDQCGVQHACGNRSRSDPDRDRVGAGAGGKPAGRYPGAVPGHLGRRAIRIPDPDVERGSVAAQNLDDAVGTDALLGITQARRVCGSQITCIRLLDHDVAVTERMPLREPHVHT